MESRGNQGASGFVVECECTERAGRSKKEQNSFLEDSEGNERSGIQADMAAVSSKSEEHGFKLGKDNWK